MSARKPLPQAVDRLVVLSNEGGLVVAGLVGAERVVFGFDPVPSALDFPDCRKCAAWEDAGASWPRPCKEHHGGEPTESTVVTPSRTEKDSAAPQPADNAHSQSSSADPTGGPR